MQRYEIETYTTDNGNMPFREWHIKIKDKKAQTKIYSRLKRASFGNFGDHKSIQGVKDLFELREHYGCGYRIYYSILGNKIILILAGSIKNDQDKTITKVANYLKDFKQRNPYEK